MGKIANKWSAIAFCFILDFWKVLKKYNQIQNYFLDSSFAHLLHQKSPENNEDIWQLDLSWWNSLYAFQQNFFTSEFVFLTSCMAVKFGFTCTIMLASWFTAPISNEAIIDFLKVIFSMLSYCLRLARLSDFKNKISVHWIYPSSGTLKVLQFWLHRKKLHTLLKFSLNPYEFSDSADFFKILKSPFQLIRS